MKGKTIVILGPVGQGKTFGLKFANPKKTIAIVQKELPWIGWEKDYIINKNLLMPTSPNKVLTELNSIVVKAKNGKMTNLELVLIDDVSIIPSDELNKRSNEGGWDKFNDIGLFFHKLMMITKSLNTLGIHVILTGHPNVMDGESSNTKSIGLQTYSKFANEKVNILGKVFAIFHTHIEEDYEPTDAEEKYEILNPDYRFIVNKTTDFKSVRSPYGLFNGNSIPNNYKLILDVIKAKT